jgi:Leucine-rich repeat (LRR) protein
MPKDRSVGRAANFFKQILSVAIHRLGIGIVLVVLLAAFLGCSQNPAGLNSLIGSTSQDEILIRKLENNGFEFDRSENGEVEATIRPSTLKRATPSDFGDLARIGRLHVLRIEIEPPTDEEFLLLAGSNVQELLLSGPKFTDQHLGSISHLTNLTSLTLTNTSISGKNFAALSNIPGLEILQIQIAPLEQAKGLQLCPLLDTVIIDTCQCPDDFWVDLAQVPTLRNLSVDESNIAPTALDLIAEKDHIRSLVLLDCQLTTSMAGSIGGIDSLEQLLLGHSNVDDSFVRGLCKESESRLRSIDLSSTKISDASIKELRRLQMLESLDIRDTAVTDASVEDLCSMRQLHVAMLEGTKISKAGASRVSTCMEEHWNRMVEEFPPSVP